MPELPEVEVTKNGISSYIEGNFIKDIIIRKYQLRNIIPNNLPVIIKGLRLKKITRRAKYLIFDLEKGFLIIHLGMSGRLRIINNNDQQINEINKHDHVDIIFNNNVILRYHDPRRFGLIDWHYGNLYDFKYLKNLGWEPFDKNFEASCFYNLLKNKNKNIKSLLMDSKIVVGIGNIYASEILFKSGILPSRSCKNISLSDCEKIIEQTRLILQESIRLGGSSLKDFYHADGSIGYFQQNYYVYGRSGQFCKVCNSIIKSEVISQRNSFFCTNCQS